ncbi:MAG: hypothetical protein D6795_05745 [Deltaproteobacteria bacterium]|nr:MAG: hypothetical protein D6795_05745 [Deltaproteobacteria bacterium]
MRLFQTILVLGTVSAGTIHLGLLVGLDDPFGIQVGPYLLVVGLHAAFFLGGMRVGKRGFLRGAIRVLREEMALGPEVLVILSSLVLLFGIAAFFMFRMIAGYFFGIEGQVVWCFLADSGFWVLAGFVTARRGDRLSAWARERFAGRSRVLPFPEGSVVFPIYRRTPLIALLAAASWFVVATGVGLFLFPRLLPWFPWTLPLLLLGVAGHSWRRWGWFNDLVLHSGGITLVYRGRRREIPWRALEGVTLSFGPPRGNHRFFRIGWKGPKRGTIAGYLPAAMRPRLERHLRRHLDTLTLRGRE